jgi:hypothetical protein
LRGSGGEEKRRVEEKRVEEKRKEEKRRRARAIPV